MSLYNHNLDPEKWYYDMCDAEGCYCWEVRRCLGPTLRYRGSGQVVYYWANGGIMDEGEIEGEYL